MHLSVAAPAYNEADGIETIIESWQKFLSTHPDIEQFEIVVCNDGSTDATKNILQDLAQRFATVRPIHLFHNQGAASALATAIQHTQYPWVFLIDTDDQFPIESINPMLHALKQSHAKAILTKRQKKDHAFARFGSWFSGFLCNIIHGSHVYDFNSACKLIEGDLVRSFHLEAKGMNYSTEMTSRILESGVAFAQVDIDHRLRSIGVSHLKWFRDSVHRLLFIGYLALRQLLVKLNILRSSDDRYY